MQVSLKYAEEHLADLVSAAYRGEEVEIAQPANPRFAWFWRNPS